ncbi:TPA: hypothetical protein N0F65_012217 [Lagenidium giganteum]|uniref:Uncharacterized protein n=1 Tax=Lagenidium giganteum TaxID=4803 RepID=A0AAV2ZIP6_9STRA|nr:TPA: hypothetical protein N0F65_012217 [Lagenidium giganteum]
MATAAEYVLVDHEPLHKEKWRSDTVRLVRVQFPPHTRCLWHQHVKYGIYICIEELRAYEQAVGKEKQALFKQRGEVFCRDHTKDKLIHVVETGEETVFIVEVELLAEKITVPNGSLPFHQSPSLVCLHHEDVCRVYRITLLSERPQVELVLPTGGVVVALDKCEVTVHNPTVDDKIHADHARDIPGETKTLEAGDEFVVVPGKFTMKLSSQHAGAAGFILAETY